MTDIMNMKYDSLGMYEVSILMLNEDITSIERYIETIQTAFHLMEEKYCREEPRIEQGDYYDGPEQKYWELIDVFPKLTWESTFVTIISLLEYETKSLALRVGKILGKSEFYAPKDVVKNAIQYLKKTCCVNFSTNTKYWNDITTFIKIRNILVHNKKYINKDKEAIEEYQRKHDDIFKINSNAEFEFFMEFCTEVVKNIKLLFQDLDAECRKVISNQ